MTTPNLWPSPNEAARKPFDSESYLNGAVLANRAAKWIEGHHQDFLDIYRIVKNIQREGIRGRLWDRIVAEAMKRGIHIEDGGFTFANDLRAGISRYLVIYDPTLKNNPIQFSQSDIDVYGLPPIDLTFPDIPF